jgi:hypothetical protein
MGALFCYTPPPPANWNWRTVSNFPRKTRFADWGASFGGEGSRRYGPTATIRQGHQERLNYLPDSRAKTGTAFWRKFACPKSLFNRQEGFRSQGNRRIFLAHKDLCSPQAVLRPLTQPGSPNRK